jgi:hypothetical protein
MGKTNVEKCTLDVCDKCKRVMTEEDEYGVIYYCKDKYQEERRYFRADPPIRRNEVGKKFFKNKRCLRQLNFYINKSFIIPEDCAYMLEHIIVRKRPE